jgi:hypothetical protein
MTFTITFGADSETFNFYVQPNPNGYGIIDLQTVVDKFCYVDTLPNGVSSQTVHTYSPSAFYFNGDYSAVDVEYSVQEAWLVDGVLEDSPTGSSSAIMAQNLTAFAGSFQPWQGYKPALSTYLYSGNDVYVLTRRNDNNWKFAGNYGLEDATAIPVYQDDWGVMSYIADNTITDELRYTIFDASGTQLDTYDFTLPTGGSVATKISFLPIYPKSLSNWVFGMTIDTPDSSTDWAYYTCEFLLSNASVSKKYVFYKVEECRYDNTRIAFENGMGGWDYFDFDKKRTPSIQVERKRYKKVLGNFSSTYDHDSWDRGMTDFGVNTERYIEVSKGNLTTADYELLTYLVKSTDIQIIPPDDSPVIEGLVLENREWAEEQLKRAEYKEITLRFRYSNDMW